MSDLDEKLKAYYVIARQSGNLAVQSNYLIDEQQWIAQIKQAFIDAGYVQIPNITIVDQFSGPGQPEPTAFMVNDKIVMTGQEYFDRFIQEARKENGFTDNQIGYIDAKYANAARRAAGIPEDKA